jgi:predicted heme/steroid binding protein
MSSRPSSWLRLLGLTVLLLGVVVPGLGGHPAWGTIEFTCETGQSCSVCHEDPEGGGTLTSAGRKFMDAGYVWGGEASLASLKLVVRLVMGFLHILAAVVWFGAIFYIHLFVKPSSLMGGLPRAERILGWVCILVVAGTGALLTVLRVHSLKTFWTTTFGIIWLVKVGLFLMMVGIAALVTTRLNKLMRAAREAGEPSISDGKEGRPTQFVYNGHLYDASESKLWAGGAHVGRHYAGADLSAAMADAPHDTGVLERVRKVGPPPSPGTAKTSGAARAFVVLAYVILFFMLAILFCVAYWNWGPPLLSASVG